MKTPSNELFKLIKSLDTQEKVYFKKSQRSNRYIKVFDILNKIPAYDENKLKEKLKNKNLTKNLKFLKSYTYDAIIKCLENYHSDDSVIIMLSRYIRQIDFLINKRLFNSAMKIINKAEKIAADNECFPYLFTILGLKHSIMVSEINLVKMDKYINDEYPEELKHIDNYKNLVEYKKLNIQRIRIIAPQVDIPDKGSIKNLKALLKNPLLKNNNKHLSNSAQEIRYRILGNIYYRLQNWKKCSNYLKKSIQLFEKKYSLQQTNITDYLWSICMVIPSLAKENKNEEVLLTKNKAEHFIKSLSAKQRTRNVYYLYLRIINNYIDTQIKALNIHDALNYSEEVKDDMDKKGNAEDFRVFYYNFFLIHFYNADYKKALLSINKILTYPQSDIREDIFNAAMILNIVVHYELGNFEMISGLCKSTYNYLEKKECLNKAWELLLYFFSNHALETTDKQKKVKLFKELKRGFEKISSDLFENKIFDYFDFISWIESKIENQTFLKVSREKL